MELLDYFLYENLSYVWLIWMIIHFSVQKCSCLKLAHKFGNKTVADPDTVQKGYRGRRTKKHHHNHTSMPLLKRGMN